mmetsp:Transcript_833/g.2220  ORF Transcript_833/g.2220 Transcript_833/m.2220 type:complete len:353 (+) Transcript_833:254-1312(+)
MHAPHGFSGLMSFVSVRITLLDAVRLAAFFAEATLKDDERRPLLALSLWRLRSTVRLCGVRCISSLWLRARPTTLLRGVTCASPPCSAPFSPDVICTQYSSDPIRSGCVPAPGAAGRASASILPCRPRCIRTMCGGSISGEPAGGAVDGGGPGGGGGGLSSLYARRGPNGGEDCSCGGDMALVPAVESSRGEPMEKDGARSPRGSEDTVLGRAGADPGGVRSSRARGVGAFLGRLTDSTATARRSSRFSVRSCARAVPMTFRSAQSDPVGMLTSMFVPRYRTGLPVPPLRTRSTARTTFRDLRIQNLARSLCESPLSALLTMLSTKSRWKRFISLQTHSISWSSISFVETAG